MSNTVEVVQSFSPVIGLILPYFQEFCNRVVSRPLSVFGFVISESEQKLGITYILSFLLALIATVNVEGINWGYFLTNMGAVFMLSQATYRLYFKSLR